MCHSCEHKHNHHSHEHSKSVMCGNNEYNFVSCEHKCCHEETDVHVAVDSCSCVECRGNHTSYFIPLVIFTSLYLAYLELYATLII